MLPYIHIFIYSHFSIIYLSLLNQLFIMCIKYISIFPITLLKLKLGPKSLLFLNVSVQGYKKNISKWKLKMKEYPFFLYKFHRCLDHCEQLNKITYAVKMFPRWRLINARTIWKKKKEKKSEDTNLGQKSNWIKYFINLL